jgi:hypothetical protein
MSAERRLAKLESALSPTAAVLLWLEEAQAYPSLVAYSRSTLDAPRSAGPLERVVEQADRAAREALRGQGRETVSAGAARARRRAAFRFELVLGLNCEAEEVARLEGLRASALFFQMRALTADPLFRGVAARRRDPIGVERHASAWQSWRDLVAVLLVTVELEEEARAQLEVRYLDGHAALFADAAGEWANLREMADQLVKLAAILPPPGVAVRTDLAEVARSDRPDGDRAERVTARVAALADQARMTALDILGDREGAAAIVERRLRSGGQ